MVAAFVRADASQCGFCTPGQIVSAAALVEADPEPGARADPARDGGEPLPLRHLSEDRGGDSHVARLIRTEKEVEGRYEEVWLVVEEDPLEQWPDGPLDVVGRPAPRSDGPQRASGKAIYTADLALPGMLHTAVLRSPYARARVEVVRRGARARGARRPRGARARRIAQLVDEANYQGAVDRRRRAPTRSRRPRGARRCSTSSSRCSSRCSTRRRRSRRSELHGEPRAYDRGDVERGFAEADVVVEATYRTQTVLHNSMETHQSVCDWEGDQLVVYISTQFIWGIRNEIAEATSGCRRTRCASSASTWAAASASKNSAGDYTYIAAELAKRTGRPVKCALTRREENLDSGNRNATIQKLRAGARADGTLTALEGEFIAALGWAGWHASTAGPMQMLYACDNVRTVEHAREAEHAADEGVPRAGFRRGDVRPRVPARRARGEARHRPARDPAPQLRALDRRTVLLLEEPDGVLRARGDALGAPRTR